MGGMWEGGFLAHRSHTRSVDEACQSVKAMGGFHGKQRNWLPSLERLTAHPATAVIVGIWGRMDHWLGAGRRV